MSVKLDPAQWDHEDLSGILSLLHSANEWTPCTATTWLDPGKVLAKAWNPQRLERCRRRLAAGEAAPAVHVVGYRIGRTVVYGVSDGMHRTTAAREAGRRIKARIGGHYLIRPERYLVTLGWLWRQSNDELGTRYGVTAVDETRVAQLTRLGVTATPPQ